jgi:hypothetical protein
MLLSRISGSDRGITSSIFTPELVVRASTARP